MIIGINAAAAFKQPRTGVEEYCYQIIKHMAMLEESKKHRFVLYVPKKIKVSPQWDLPNHFEIKYLDFPVAWTQGRLAIEMFKNMPNVLFIPVHVLPLVHPFASVVTIHGLEYEYHPDMYSSKQVKYLRWATKYAAEKARSIIAVSKTTKNDLVKLYNINPEKIMVIQHGVDHPGKLPRGEKGYKYLFYIGRIEEKKGLKILIAAFNILKEKYRVPHKLILAGPDGFGSEVIKKTANLSAYFKDIFFPGYLDEEEKIFTLRNASVFVWPSMREGFGMPLLEAMAWGVPIVASKISINEEVTGNAALFFDLPSESDLAGKINRVIKSDELARELIKSGRMQVKKYSWQRASKKTLKLLTEL
ncbi:MAG: hypothetical protein COU81_01050 [Candidatus Portnoybacteria bacterium CG10_big_fil_rev_8_21_14_0_10_36_7]|uniref:Glycosyltransferase family 1 protein n=1 Tax=Candidatus Portnoybacteria bacterium CG10_big_fil_rev_8_21_14_0_10_36_7 TaxID=1974812 RepID=A0A2M8KEN1_9BACT|nr:MAG: hypothetical protein COU81_01050 [Candidatus Portnoybacteria bacterium CG10_big_fil_rev_8_21_14_0_10_36_7]